LLTETVAFHRTCFAGHVALIEGMQSLLAARSAVSRAPDAIDWPRLNASHKSPVGKHKSTKPLQFYSHSKSDSLTAVTPPALYLQRAAWRVLRVLPTFYRLLYVYETNRSVLSGRERPDGKNCKQAAVQAWSVKKTHTHTHTQTHTLKWKDANKTNREKNQNLSVGVWDFDVTRTA
jgi:hypothetical protein